MSHYGPILAWIDGQHERLVTQVRTWAEIASGTHNLAGLARLAEVLERDFASLGGEGGPVPLPDDIVVEETGQVACCRLGRALLWRKYPRTSRRVLLGIHYDTVYPQTTAKVRCDEGGRMWGPGVCDAKGGLVVLRAALEAWERSEWAGRWGWDVLLNPDEEIGSPGSRGLWAEAAGRCDVGLLFEPALPDGSLVSGRRGSGNFVVVVRGRAAHAGRDPSAGRNAIHALAQIVVDLARLPEEMPGVSVTVGQIRGGGASNIVPDLAVGRFNVRFEESAAQTEVVERIQAKVNAARRDGIAVELHGGIGAPPKVLDEAAAQLLAGVVECGRELGMTLGQSPSGGVSDGNRLAAAGLPTIDSLGPRGGGLHTTEEFLWIDSLTERAKLTALVLLKLTSGEIPWPPKQRVVAGAAQAQGGAR